MNALLSPHQISFVALGLAVFAFPALGSSADTTPSAPLTLTATLARVEAGHPWLRGRDAEVALNLVDALDEHDDVTHVYVDFDVPEEELRRIAGE